MTRTPQLAVVDLTPVGPTAMPGPSLVPRERRVRPSSVPELLAELAHLQDEVLQLRRELGISLGFPGEHELPLHVARRITPDPVTHCWIWGGCLDEYGYGRVRANGRQWIVHRFVYTVLVEPIPDGLTLDHVQEWGCTSHACCWPGHLEPVTSGENVRRGNRAREPKTRCPSGHELTPENTRIESGYRRCRKCRNSQRGGSK